MIQLAKDRNHRVPIFFVRILRQAGGLSRKAPSNARGDDPFLGGFFFSFFRPHPGEVPQPGFTPAFAGIFVSARAGYFIVRELAEFG